MNLDLPDLDVDLRWKTVLSSVAGSVAVRAIVTGGEDTVIALAWREEETTRLGLSEKAVEAKALRIRIVAIPIEADPIEANQVRWIPRVDDVYGSHAEVRKRGRQVRSRVVGLKFIPTRRVEPKQVRDLRLVLGSPGSVAVDSGILDLKKIEVNRDGIDWIRLYDRGVVVKEVPSSIAIPTEGCIGPNGTVYLTVDFYDDGTASALQTIEMWGTIDSGEER